jgi:hypothetical protein
MAQFPEGLDWNTDRTSAAARRLLTDRTTERSLQFDKKNAPSTQGHMYRSRLVIC